MLINKYLKDQLEIWPNFLHQFQQIKFRLLIIISLISFLIYGTFLFCNVYNIPYPYLTRDVAAVANVKIYAGIISNLGIMLWIGSFSVLFFSYFISKQKFNKKQSMFFLFSGIISFILYLDDAFLFHDEIFPHMLHIPEKAIYLAYVLMYLGFLVFFISDILKTDYIFLFLFFVFSGTSVFLDITFQFSEGQAFLEDSLKFAGIVMWFSYFFFTSKKIVVK